MSVNTEHSQIHKIQSVFYSITESLNLRGVVSEGIVLNRHFNCPLSDVTARHQGKPFTTVTLRHHLKLLALNVAI